MRRHFFTCPSNARLLQTCRQAGRLAACRRAGSPATRCCKKRQKLPISWFVQNDEIARHPRAAATPLLMRDEDVGAKPTSMTNHFSAKIAVSASSFRECKVCCRHLACLLTVAQPSHVLPALHCPCNLRRGTAGQAAESLQHSHLVDIGCDGVGPPVALFPAGRESRQGKQAGRQGVFTPQQAAHAEAASGEHSGRARRSLASSPAAVVLSPRSAKDSHGNRL